MAGVDLLATAFTGANAAYIADSYARWVADPASVDASFAALFENLDDEERAVLTDASGASWSPRAFDVGDADQKPPARRATDVPRERPRKDASKTRSCRCACAMTKDTIPTSS